MNILLLLAAPKTRGWNVRKRRRKKCSTTRQVSLAQLSVCKQRRSRRRKRSSWELTSLAQPAKKGSQLARAAISQPVGFTFFIFPFSLRSVYLYPGMQFTPYNLTSHAEDSAFSLYPFFFVVHSQTQLTQSLSSPLRKEREWEIFSSLSQDFPRFYLRGKKKSLLRQTDTLLPD